MYFSGSLDWEKEKSLSVQAQISSNCLSRNKVNPLHLDPTQTADDSADSDGCDIDDQQYMPSSSSVDGNLFLIHMKLVVIN